MFPWLEARYHNRYMVTWILRWRIFSFIFGVYQRDAHLHGQLETYERGRTFLSGGLVSVQSMSVSIISVNIIVSKRKAKGRQFLNGNLSARDLWVGGSNSIILCILVLIFSLRRIADTSSLAEVHIHRGAGLRAIWRPFWYTGGQPQRLDIVLLQRPVSRAAESRTRPAVRAARDPCV